MQKILMLAIMILLLCHGNAHSFDVDDLEIHGFASTGFLKSDHNNYLVPSEDGSFEFTEAGLNVTTSLTDDIRIGMQLFSRDQGDVGNNDIILDWAFLDYRWKEELGLRLGKMKLPQGLYNDMRDYDILRTSILLPQSVYDKNYRETAAGYQGAGIYGNVSLGKGGSLGYDAVIGTFGIEAGSAAAERLSSLDEEFQSAEIDSLAGGRLKWRTPLQGLMFGGSIVQIDMAYWNELTASPVELEIDMPEMRIFFLFAEYNHENWTVAVEYSGWKYDYTVYLDMSQLGQPNPDTIESSVDSQAYYGLISYRFTDWFEVGTYYSVYYPDRHDRDGEEQVAAGKPDYTAWQKDLALTTRFDITDFWLVKLEVHFMDGVALCTSVDNPDGFEEDWMLFAINTTFNF